MKKVFALLCLTALTLFASCGDDDSNNTNDKIVGTWRYTGYIDENGTFDPETDEDLECYEDLLTFNKNGTGQVVSKDCDFGDDSYQIQWSKGNGDMYIFSYDDETEQAKVTFEGNTTMKFHYEGLEADVFKRVQ
ncbi:MAG: hypothetical protein DI539_08080 [Flavobacterium psychrophilum]|nr:MAG: hypothetical protein DI539_08080 [Flavobacterium psychrophilum]